MMRIDRSSSGKGIALFVYGHSHCSDDRVSGRFNGISRSCKLSLRTDSAGKRSKCSIFAMKFIPNSQLNSKSTKLSVANALSGALLGPLLDNYHSAFGVLRYEHPQVLHWTSFGTAFTITTQWWVPFLFALAGVIIGNGVVWLDTRVRSERERKERMPAVLISISAFSGQYWLSGLLASQLESSACTLCILTATGVATWVTLGELSVSIGLMSLATAISGPMIEIVLINYAHFYHYSNPDILGIPLWIIPVYFAGGTAVGKLSRKYHDWI